MQPRVTLTESTLRKLENNPNVVAREVKDEIARSGRPLPVLPLAPGVPERVPALAVGDIADDDILGWKGGFDVVLGNPPWERIKIQEQEWFARRRPDIAKAPNAAARRKMIQHLAEENPDFCSRRSRTTAEWPKARATSSRNSGRYPLCGRGDVNTYTLFAETGSTAHRGDGPGGHGSTAGIVYDDTTKHFFRDLMERRSLVELLPLRERGVPLPGGRSPRSLQPHDADRSRTASLASTDFVFFARRVEHLSEPDRHFTPHRRGDPADEPEHGDLPDLPDPSAMPRSTRPSTAAFRF